jgi:hypothetical protein
MWSPRAAPKRRLPDSRLSEKEDVLMATKPNFNSSLQLPSAAERRAAKRAGKEPPGPVARGPKEAGDEILWIYVWLIQNGEMGGDTWAAAAYGEHPEEEHSESAEEEHSKSAEESAGERSFEGESSWEVRTEMAEHGNDFREGPAIATSMALLEREDNSREVYWWTEAVVLKKRRRQQTTRGS